jgi:chaperone BCS1
MARLPRPLSTVILEQEQKNSFIDDIKEYLHPRTRRWYSNRGIPYRRGYLFHGPPGTGKTSLCFAAAGLLGLKLYLLNLNSTALDEDGLASLFASLPRRCIVLLEDIDVAGITSTRGKTIVSTAEPTIDEIIPSEGDGEADATVAADTSAKGGVTLSGLLNVIDGVAASEGRILVMTTNHADKLDPALLRPGRVDMTINFGYTSEADIKEMFISIYNTTTSDIRRSKKSRTVSNRPVKSNAGEEKKKFKDSLVGDKKDPLQDTLQSRISGLADEFAAIIPSGELTAAEIQGYLLNHKEMPEAAIRGAPEWVQNALEKKRAREEKEKIS